MPPRISKHFAIFAKCYFLFYDHGNQLWERLSFLPRDIEGMVAEPGQGPKSPELHCCVLVTADQGVGGHCVSALTCGAWGGARWRWHWGSLTVGRGAEWGRICPEGCSCPPGLGWSALDMGGSWGRAAFDHCCPGRSSRSWSLQPALPQAPLRSKNN